MKMETEAEPDLHARTLIFS